MQKKYIIAIVVVIALAGAFFILTGKKQKADDQAFVDQTDERLVEIANKSARAGLAQMGRALNQYKEDMGVYPDQLMDLYPKHMNMKEFITEVNWKYEKQTDNFLLSKTIVKGRGQEMASVDKELRPYTGETIMMASIEQSVAQSMGSRRDATAQTDVSATVVLKPQYLADGDRKRVFDGQTGPVIDRPEIVASRLGKIREGMGADLGKKYLVWKDDRGHLGFGNLVYPDRSRLTTYAEGSWLDISFPEAAQRKTRVEDMLAASAKTDKDALAAHYSRNLLVWKNEGGVLGFGNRTFPDQQVNRVFDQGRWTEMERTVAMAGTATSASPLQAVPKNRDEIASGLSRTMTIWKNESGHLGFGNTSISHDSGAKRIFQNNEWIEAESFSGKGAGQSTGGSMHDPKALSASEIAERQGRQFIVWKDSKGRLGFGNVLEPSGEGEDIQVHVNNAWEKVERTQRTAPGPTRMEQPDLEQKAWRLCGSMLVWKNRNGVMGFGNLDFPVAAEAEYICVNGVWEKAAN